MFSDTPCTHLVNNGIRYLIYPDLQICCNCCSDTDGYGILKPTWMNGAQYIGQSLYGSQAVESYLWNQEGVGSNFYWETVDVNPANRVMLQLNNGDRIIGFTSLMGDSRTLLRMFSMYRTILSRIPCAMILAYARNSGGRKGRVNI